MNHHKELNKKINLSRFSHPVIFLIFNNTGKEDDIENKENKNE